MFKKKPIISYESAVDFYDNVFTTAKKNIPGWYKEIPNFKNKKIFDIEKQTFNHSLKTCIPFMDALTTGYMINLPHDLLVTRNSNNGPVVTWRGDSQHAPSVRESVANPNLVPIDHFEIEFTWKLNCSFTVPIGYSMLLTHPLNRYDLPFTTLSGVVDGGYTTLHNGNVPFYIKKDFEGIILQGTPIVQVLPFYNESWLSKKKNGLLDESIKNNKKSYSVIFGWYKKTFWTQKKYL